MTKIDFPKSHLHSSVDCIVIRDIQRYESHLFSGGFSFSSHVQSTAAHGSGSRSKGSGRADKEGGNSELHVDKDRA